MGLHCDALGGEIRNNMKTHSAAKPMNSNSNGMEVTVTSVEEVKEPQPGDYAGGPEDSDSKRRDKMDKALGAGN